MQEKILGVLGGVGPLATVYFMDMLVKMTDAETDQQHIPVLCFNHATIPDRTAYILDNSNENPLPVMERDAQLLEKAGASCIVTSITRSPDTASTWCSASSLMVTSASARFSV